MAVSLLPVLLLVPTSAHAGPAAGPVAVRDAVGRGDLSVRIAGFAPAIPGPDDVLVVSGTVTNTSDLSVTDVSVSLRVSPTPLIRAEIPQVLAGDPAREGLRVPDTLTSVATDLAPGQSVPFELRSPVSTLGLGAAGAYVTGAEAVGDSGTGVVRQDIDRTFLPWWPEDTASAPLLLTTLWPLSATPDRDAEGVLLTEDMAVDMSPAGRLSTLVSTGAKHPGSFTWLVDPQVLDAADAMSDGYLVRSRGTTADGTRASEVRTWLAQVTTALTAPQASATATLYAMPDAVAARRGRVLDEVLAQRAAVDAATQRILGRALPSTVAVLPGGNADDVTLQTLAAADVAPAVLADWAVPPTAASFFTPSGSVTWPTGDGDLPLLLTDTGMSQALAMPATSPAEVTALRQRLLAETLATVQQLPSTQRLLVASPQQDWAPSAAAAEAVLQVVDSTPWIVPVTLPAALQREPSTVPRTHTAYGTAQQEAQLPAATVRAARDQYRGIAQYAAILTEPGALPAAAPTAPTRLLSGWFRTRDTQREALRRTINEQVDEALSSVTVVSSGSITVSGAAGTIPITVENAGSVGVRVGLTFTATPPQVFHAGPVEPFDVAPGRRTSVEVPAEVTAGGRIPVTIRLVTREGDSFGESATLIVRSSAYANAARILVRASLAVLVIAVGVHGVRRFRRARRRRGEPAQDSATPQGKDPAGSPAPADGGERG